MFDEYEVITPEANASSKAISDMWIRLGKPNSPLSESGVKLMDIIISVWADLNPKEYRDWTANRAEYKDHELDIKEQVKKHTGRSLASYPYPVYQIMSKVFPNFNSTERENCIKMIKKFPIFKLPNKI